jgi:hypothetical protein
MGVGPPARGLKQRRSAGPRWDIGYPPLGERLFSGPRVKGMAVANQRSNASSLSWLVGSALGLILLPIALLVKLLVWPFERPIRRAPHEVAGILHAYLDETLSDTSWDDFVSVPIADPRLEAMRDRCLHLEQEFPPEQRASREESSPHHSYVSQRGQEVVRAWIEELEAAEQADAPAEARS